MTPVQHLLLAATLAAAAAAMAQDKPMPGALNATAVKVTATVVAIDPVHRNVTLKGEDGTVSEFKVGPEVKNLAQVKVGDRVTSEYVRAVALLLKKGEGIRGTTEQQRSAAAQPGQKPAAGVSTRTVITADVTRIDPQAGLVTLKGPKGRVVDVQVADPATLARIKVGDQVEATITEALMIAVTPPAAK